MISPRKQLLASLVGLSLYTALAVGSTGSAAPIVANVQNIMRAVETVQLLLKGAQLLSAATSNSVDAAYTDLSERVQDENFSVGSIQEMEQTYAGMRAQADSLGWTLAATKNSANQLFELLEQRAKENGTPELQSLMMTDIKSKRLLFNEHLAAAEAAMARVNASIRKYNDILGFVQVNKGLEQVEQYISQIQSVAGEAETLDREIQHAINAGMQIISSFDDPA